MADSSAEVLVLVQQCLDRGYSVDIVCCGQFAKPGKPYLCRVHSGHGSALRDHLLYGDDAPGILAKAMQHVLVHGFTKNQDRYGLRGTPDARQQEHSK